MWKEVCDAFTAETGIEVELIVDKSLEGVIGPSMQNTILLIVTVTIITFFFAIVFAAILTREKIKGQNFFRIVFYIPNILSVVVIAGIFSAVYKPDNGMLNSIFSLFAGREIMVLWKDQPMVIVSVIIATASCG